VKCPYSRPINGSIPRQYISQVQYGMSIMNTHGADIGNHCYFIQYKPQRFGKPFEQQILSVKKIPRDPEYVTSKMDKVAEFKNTLKTYRDFHDFHDEKSFFLEEVEEEEIKN
jgi:hypothetical protein